MWVHLFHSDHHFKRRCDPSSAISDELTHSCGSYAWLNGLPIFLHLNINKLFHGRDLNISINYFEMSFVPCIFTGRLLIPFTLLCSCFAYQQSSGQSNGLHNVQQRCLKRQCRWLTWSMTWPQHSTYILHSAVYNVFILRCLFSYLNQQKNSSKPKIVEEFF